MPPSENYAHEIVVNPMTLGIMAIYISTGFDDDL